MLERTEEVDAMGAARTTQLRVGALQAWSLNKTPADPVLDECRGNRTEHGRADAL
jgi:hypothetical protein